MKSTHKQERSYRSFNRPRSIRPSARGALSGADGRTSARSRGFLWKLEFAVKMGRRIAPPDLSICTRRDRDAIIRRLKQLLAAGVRATIAGTTPGPRGIAALVEVVACPTERSNGASPAPPGVRRGRRTGNGNPPSRRSGLCARRYFRLTTQSCDRVLPPRAPFPHAVPGHVAAHQGRRDGQRGFDDESFAGSHR